MNVFQAMVTGIRRVHGAKRYLFLVYLINVLVAVALGAALAGAIKDSLGSSLAAENLRQGFDDLWYRSFSANARGLSSTFTPSVVGIGAILNGLDAFLQGGLLGEYVAIVAVGLFYLLMWSFFAAGFISVYKGDRGDASFFAQAARFFPRFLILAVLAGILYILIFRFVFQWLSNGVEALTLDVIDERIAFLYTVIKFALVWMLVYAVNLVFDYSKILTVVRDHRNALTAPLKGVAFVFGNFGRTVGLYFALGLSWIVLFAVYWLIAPGAGQASTVAILGAFILGQLYILSRMWTRCLFYGSQTALYEAVGHPSDVA